MCRNRKMLLAGCLLITVCMFTTACSSGKKLFSDVGTDISEEVDIGRYLDISRLSQNQSQETTYTTHVIEYGTFTNAGTPIPANPVFCDLLPVKVEAEEGTMVLVSREVDVQSYVEVGDVIATVTTKTDAADVMREERKLERLKEQYERAKTEFDKQREKALSDNQLIYDQYERKADSILIERDLMEWERTAKNYEQQIRDAEESVADVRKKSSRISILAPAAGGVYAPEQSLSIGDELKNGTILCYIRNYDFVLLGIENRNQAFRYGMNVDVVYKNSIYDKTDSITQAQVVAGTPDDLYGNLTPANNTVNLQPEATAWQGNVTYSTGTMENVLLVPVKAVTVEEDVPYVTVVKPDGGFLRTGFTAGGSNHEYYWVLSGLEEGTTILMGE